MRVNKDRLAAKLAGRVPRSALAPWLTRALEGHHLALCLHRVLARRRPTDWQPAMTIPPGELDALLSLLLDAVGPGALTVAFDDGYADAAEYLADRAPRHPEIAFLFCVCPEKLEQRAGFRWDLVEEATRTGAPPDAARALLEAPVDLASENARSELRALADRDDYRLADLSAVRALGELRNVTLVNHTNCHLKATRLPLAEIELEYRRSREAFARLFGPETQFAFPFGTPRHQFDERHVAALRALGDSVLWTTEPRPFLPSERRPGAVLPRFPVDGTLSHLELAAWIAVRSTDFRVRGTRHRY